MDDTVVLLTKNRRQDGSRSPGPGKIDPQFRHTKPGERTCGKQTYSGYVCTFIKGHRGKCVPHYGTGQVCR